MDIILEAATRVLERHGFAAATTNRIAEVAGVSVGSLYQYYPNKLALVTALHERHFVRVGGLLAAALAEGLGRPLDEILERLVAAVIHAHREQPRLQRVLHAELPQLEPSLAESAAKQALGAQVRAMLEAHRERMAVPDLSVATAIVLPMVEGLVHATVLAPLPGVTDDVLAREVVRAVRGYLGVV